MLSLQRVSVVVEEMAYVGREFNLVDRRHLDPIEMLSFEV